MCAGSVYGIIPVSGNVSGAWGGGLSLHVSDAATLSENTVFSNSATYGGRLYISHSGATLVGNTVASNPASVFGGGLELQFSAEEIRSYCREQLAGYKVPRHVEFRENLPKTMVGKVLRRVLAQEDVGKMCC